MTRSVRCRSTFPRAALRRLGWVCAAACAAAPAWADNPKVKPGLWEHSMDMRSQSGRVESAMAQMQAQLDKMTPAQRQQMEAMMGSMGVGLGQQRSSFRVCLSPEEAAKLEDVESPEENCRQEVLERSAKRMKVRFHCTGEHPTEGEGDYRFDGDSGYSGTSVMKTVIDGKPDQMTMNHTAKWVSADCGSIKPGARAPVKPAK